MQLRVLTSLLQQLEDFRLRLNQAQSLFCWSNRACCIVCSADFWHLKCFSLSCEWRSWILWPLKKSSLYWHLLILKVAQRWQFGTSFISPAYSNSYCDMILFRNGSVKFWPTIITTFGQADKNIVFALFLMRLIKINELPRVNENLFMCF